MAIADDFDGLLSDPMMGVDVYAGSARSRGILDRPDHTLGTGIVSDISTAYVLTMKTAEVARLALANGVSVTIANVKYVVKTVMALDDGAFSHVGLAAI